MRSLAMRFLRDVLPDNFNGVGRQGLHGLCQRLSWKALAPGIKEFLSRQKRPLLQALEPNRRNLRTPLLRSASLEQRTPCGLHLDGRRPDEGRRTVGQARPALG